MRKAPKFCTRCKVPHAGQCPVSVSNWDIGTKKRSGRGGRPWRRVREGIFRRDDYLCQAHLKRNEHVFVRLHGPDAGVCDHIIPLEEGGTDEDDNLQTLCQQCSDDKTKQEALRGKKRKAELVKPPSIEE